MCLDRNIGHLFGLGLIRTGSGQPFLRTHKSSVTTTPFAKTRPISATFPSMLPFELWGRILRLATSNPSKHMLHDDHILEPDFCKPNIRASYYFDSRKTKRAVVLVCKTWHSIAIKFLYEDVWLSNFDRLKALKDNLTRQSEGVAGGGSNRRNYGWWIKELTITVPYPSASDPQVLPFVTSLLMLCPNLSILVMSGRFEDKGKNYGQLARSIQDWTPKLECLDVHQLGEGQAKSSHYLFNISSLRTLRIKWEYNIIGRIPQFRHDTLTSLSLAIDKNRDIPLHKMITLPHLTSLYLRGSDLDKPSIVELVRLYGKQLLTLGLQVVPPYGDTLRQLLSIVSELLFLCSNLKEFFWHDSSTSIMPATPLNTRSGSQYHSIKLLGVSVSSVDWKKHHYLSQFPNLKTIRFIDVLERRLPVIVGEEAGVDAVKDVPLGIAIENALGNVIA